MDRLTTKSILGGWTLKVPRQEAADRLAAYEDTGLEPEEIKALIPPPNEALTLDELREMDGEPVFCVSAARPEDTAWGIVRIRGINPYVRTIKGGCSTFFYLTSYNSAWLAYRHKPEEGSR